MEQPAVIFLVRFRSRLPKEEVLPVSDYEVDGESRIETCQVLVPLRD